MTFDRKWGLAIVAAAAVGAGSALAATSPATNTSDTTAATSASTDSATDGTAATGTQTGSPEGARHWHRHGPMLVGTLLRATHQLNLTSDQKAQIKGILGSARDQARSAGAGADFTELANPGDPNYSSAVQAWKARMTSRMQSEIELQGQIYNVLTSAQKSQLPQVLASMKAKAEQHRAERQAQHTTGVGAGSN